MFNVKRVVGTAVVAVLGFGLAGCFPPQDAPPPEDQSPQAVECRTGVANALDRLGGRAAANGIACGQNTSLGEGGVYDARSGNAAVFYGWPNDPGTVYFGRVAFHEEGHAWYFQRMNADQRNRYTEIRQPWDQLESYADDFQMLTGGYSSGLYRQTPPLSPAQAQALCNEGIIPC